MTVIQPISIKIDRKESEMTRGGRTRKIHKQQFLPLDASAHSTGFVAVDVAGRFLDVLQR